MPQSIATNTAVALLGRTLQVILGFAVIAALSRILGETGFGTYSLLLAYGSLLLIGADFGLYLTFTRAAAQDPARTPQLLSEAIWVRLLGLVIIFALGGLLLPALPTLKNLWWVFWLAALGLSAQSLSQLLMGVFQARSVVWRASVGDLVGRLAQLALLVSVAALLPLLGVGEKNLLTAMVLAFTVGTVAATCAHFFLLPMRRRLQTPPNRARIGKLLAQSWPAAALLILNAIYFRIDIVLLSFFRPENEIGWYSLAYRIIESALFLPAMFGGLLLPHLSRLDRIPTKLFQESLRAIVWVGAGVCSIIALLSTPLIQFLSGPEFTPAAPLLTILSLALFVMFLGNLFGFTLVARHRERLLMWLYLTLVVFNVVANLLTLPRFGATAAAWVTVATEAIAATVAGILVYRLSPFSLPRVFVGKLLLVLGAVALLLAALPASWHVVLQAALALAAFMSLSILLGLVRPKDFHTLLLKP